MKLFSNLSLIKKWIYKIIHLTSFIRTQMNPSLPHVTRRMSHSNTSNRPSPIRSSWKPFNYSSMINLLEGPWSLSVCDIYLRLIGVVSSGLLILLPGFFLSGPISTVNNTNRDSVRQVLHRQNSKWWLRRLFTWWWRALNGPRQRVWLEILKWTEHEFFIGMIQKIQIKFSYTILRFQTIQGLVSPNLSSFE